MNEKQNTSWNLRIPRFIRYAMVGVANTATDFGIFSLLYFVIDLNAIWANAIAFLVAVTQSYLLNGGWTFRQSKKQLSFRAYLWFVLINIGGLFISTACIYLLRSLIPPLAAKLCASGLVLTWGFFLSRQFVFQNPGKPHIAKLPTTEPSTS